ncbi:hypothetical protein ACNO8X_16210 [Mycobacterium sp. PDNC021]|uniref:hypothetical protein n=1 Tax=Mycobacterium sp. PDNC021 TaxID=3391399 RepID=UPI003AAEFED4
MNDGDVRLRQWQGDDALQLARLLDPAADPLWVEHFHALHGPDRDGPGWRRTRVAVDASDQMIGCATVAKSLLHGGRFPCAVEVCTRARRLGIGTRLIEEMKALRPDRSLPLSTKLRQRNRAAIAFVSTVGGREYQCSPGIVVDPHAPGVQRWVATRSVQNCRNLEAMDLAAAGQAFAAVYEWIHGPWSPVTSKDVLLEVAATEVAEADRTSSAGTWLGGRLAAVAFAFPSAEGIEVVAETIRDGEPSGIDAVADAVATVIRSAGSHAGALVSFDSHVSDPHLQPVLADLPHVRNDPLYLIEIT